MTDTNKKIDSSLLDKVSDGIQTMSSKQKAAAGIGIAAAVAAGVAVIRKARSSSPSPEGLSIYHLEPLDDTWKLTLEGATGAEAVFDTRDEGLTAARELANDQAPSELVVYRVDGSEQSRHRYDS